MIPEINAYLEELNVLRGKVLQTLEDLTPEAWNWTPLENDANSLFVLATHMIGSEHGWIFEILGEGDKTRNRPAEFTARAIDLGELHARYARVAAETTAVLENRTASDLAGTRHREGYGDISERWIILHIIAHYGEHLGQMYLTRQLWEKTKSRVDD